MNVITSHNRRTEELKVSADALRAHLEGEGSDTCLVLSTHSDSTRVPLGALSSTETERLRNWMQTNVGTSNSVLIQKKQRGFVNRKTRTYVFFDRSPGFVIEQSA